MDYLDLFKENMNKIDDEEKKELLIITIKKDDFTLYNLLASVINEFKIGDFYKIFKNILDDHSDIFKWIAMNENHLFELLLKSIDNEDNDIIKLISNKIPKHQIKKNIIKGSNFKAFEWMLKGNLSDNDIKKIVKSGNIEFIEEIYKNGPLVRQLIYWLVRYNKHEILKSVVIDDLFENDNGIKKYDEKAYWYLNYILSPCVNFNNVQTLELIIDHVDGIIATYKSCGLKSWFGQSLKSFQIYKYIDADNTVVDRLKDRYLFKQKGNCYYLKFEQVVNFR